MTITDLDHLRLDEMLKMFDGTAEGKIPRTILLDEKDAPKDWHRAIRFLTHEGYLEEFDDYYEITYKGLAILHDGGFIKKHRHQRLLAYCTVVAAICSLLGLFVAVIALVR